jgi:23S rRNA (guanosine2251-2'-O)-methyltransferase
MPEGIRTVRKKAGVRQIYKEYVREHKPEIEIAFLLQDWDDPYNVGGMFRVADACGATELVMSGHTPVPPDPQVHVTSMGHHRRIPWQKIDRHEEAALAVKEAGYQLVAIEIAEGALPYDEYPYPERVCFVLGNEVNGVYTSVMKHRDGAVFIPMFGKGRSMNVHVAAAVVAFEALRQARVRARDKG